MVQIYGNLKSQTKILHCLQPKVLARAVAITGESYVGKRSFLLQELGNILYENDIFIANKSVEDARQAREFAFTHPILSPFKVIVVDGADFLSDESKDVYLKLCEETPSYCKIFFILEDEFRLSSPLLSRLNEIIRWSILSPQEMVEYGSSLDPDGVASSKFLDLCFGKPGLYSILSKNSEFLTISEEIIEYNFSKKSCPGVIKDLSKDDIEKKDALYWIIYNISRNIENRLTVFRLLNFASNLKKFPQISAELHFESSMMVL